MQRVQEALWAEEQEEDETKWTALTSGCAHTDAGAPFST